MGDPDGTLDPGLVVDVRLALQRRELDGDPPRDPEPARAQLARPVRLRDGGGHHRQRLARSSLLRDHGARGARLDPARVPRGGRGGRRWSVGTVLARDVAAPQAGPRGRHPVLDDLHLQRLQYRVRAHPWRARQHDAPLRDARVPDPAPRRQTRPRRGGLAVPLPPAGSRGVPPAARHPKGVGVAGARGPGGTIPAATVTYRNLLPFPALP